MVRRFLLTAAAALALAACYTLQPGEAQATELVQPDIQLAQYHAPRHRPHYQPRPHYRPRHHYAPPPVYYPPPRPHYRPRVYVEPPVYYPPPRPHHYPPPPPRYYGH